MSPSRAGAERRRQGPVDSLGFEKRVARSLGTGCRPPKQAAARCEPPVTLAVLALASIMALWFEDRLRAAVLGEPEEAREPLRCLRSPAGS